MDIVQLVLIGISIVLATLFVFLGIQVWYILKEVRLAFQKINKMLDDMGKVTGTVGEGVSGLSALASGLKAGLSIFSGFGKGETEDE